MSLLRFCTFVVLTSIALPLFAQQQELSQLGDREFLTLLQSMKSGTSEERPHDAAADRCSGLALSWEIRQRLDHMVGEDLVLLKKLTEAPTTETQIYSPLRKFIIHFDTSSQSTHTPSLLNADGDLVTGTAMEFAEQVAVFYDSAYTYYVDLLRFSAPPAPPYHIYIQELGAGSYGQTYFDGLPLNQGQIPERFKAYIIMDNNYQGYFSNGLSGARVTASHEFHHVLEVGSYGYWGSRYQYFYEMGATYYENLVFPWVNDYYQYLHFHFHYPGYPLNKPVGALSGYQKAVLFQMIAKKHGEDVLVKAWENTKSVPPEPALDNALQSVTSSFSEEICDFGQWCFYTGYRSHTGSASRHFDDAGEFPLVNVTRTEELTSGEQQFSGLLGATGSVYYTVYRDGDTVTAILTNTDVQALISDSIEQRKADYTLVIRDDQPGGPYIPLQNGWSYSVAGPSISALCTNVAVNNVIVSATLPAAVSGLSLSPVNPNPVAAGQQMACRWSLDGIANVSVGLYDLNGREVADVFRGASGPGTTSRMISTAALVPGAYFLRLRSGNRVLVSPVTVVR